MQGIVRCWVILLTHGALAVSLASATVIRVPGQYQHIQDAIDAAVNGDTVSVWGPDGASPPYTYNENPNYHSKGLFVVNRSFLPGETNYDSISDWVVIDGRNLGTTVTVADVPAGAAATLKGFTVRGGHGVGGTQDFIAGGVDARRCAICIAKNHVVGNTSDYSVGGVGGYFLPGLTLHANLIEDNAVLHPDQGIGGVFVWYGDRPDSAVITGNTIRNNEGCIGGFAYCENHLVVPPVGPYLMTDNVIVGNICEMCGVYVAGGGSASSGSPGFLFRRNTVVGNGGRGMYSSTGGGGPPESPPMDCGTQEDPGYNVLMQNEIADLYVYSDLLSPPDWHMVGNYWGSLHTSYVRSRIDYTVIPPERVLLDPVAASGKWFDVSMNSTCETDVIVTGDVTILHDCSLTILPGKTVEFLIVPDFSAPGADPGLCDLLVGSGGGSNASLTAIGTEEEPILFRARPYLEPEFPGDWYGITVNSGCAAVLNTCEVRSGYAGVTALENASLQIHNSKIYNNLFCGITTDAAMPVYITQSEISDNGVYGMSCNNVRQNTVIQGDTLYRNAIYGISMNTYNNMTDLCEIVANRIDGGPIVVTASLNGLSFRNITGSLIIDRNHVTRCSQAGVYLENVTENTWLHFDTIVNITYDGVHCGPQAYPVIRQYNMIDACKVGVFAAQGGLPFLGSVAQPGLNSILLNNGYYVYNQNTQTILAQKNWWGTVQPPPDKFIGPVSRYPWLLGPPPSGQQSGGASGISLTTALLQPAPDPARDATTIRYQIGRPELASVTITDASGRCVRRLVKGVLQPGEYSLTWDRRDDHGRRVSDGVYFIRLEAPACQEIRKVVLTR
jgi:hypothetical protein